MEATGESKSTILFYVKEGLLPEPQKPKPNLHLYDESCINIIKFIKYLQNQFSYTIAQIKTIFEERELSFSDDFSMMVRSLELMSGGADSTLYTQEEFLKLSGLDLDELQRYIKKGWLHKQEQNFSDRELKLVNIFKQAQALKFDTKLFDSYVKSAINLAKIEYEVGSQLLSQEKERNSEQYKLIFDSILTVKPYIFNMNTLKEYQTQMRDGANNEKSI